MYCEAFILIFNSFQIHLFQWHFPFFDLLVFAVFSFEKGYVSSGKRLAAFSYSRLSLWSWFRKHRPADECRYQRVLSQSSADWGFQSLGTWIFIYYSSSLSTSLHTWLDAACSFSSLKDKPFKGCSRDLGDTWTKVAWKPSSLSASRFYHMKYRLSHIKHNQTSVWKRKQQMLPCLAIARTSAGKVTALPGLSRNIYKCRAWRMPSRIQVPLPGQGAVEFSLFASVPAGTAPYFLRSWELAQEQGTGTR